MKKTKIPSSVAPKPRLSVVIPAYNESGNIPLVLARFAEAAKGRTEPFELIVVDNNSTDDTKEVLAREFGGGTYPFARTVFEPKPGYGAAIKKGLESARGEVLAWTHADLQTDPRDVFRAYDEFVSARNERSIVKGKRVGRPFGQVFFSFGMAVIASAILLKIFFEINAQPKLFNRNFFEKYLREGAPDDFSLDLFLLCQARRNGYAVRSIRVQFEKRTFGESTWSCSFSSKIRTIFRTVRYIFKLRKLIRT